MTVDGGEKPVGSVVSDARRLTAQGRGTLNRNDYMGALIRSIDEYHVQSALVGLFRMLYGSIGIQTGSDLSFVMN